MIDLLKVEDLEIAFKQREKCTTVVKGIDFSIADGETVALVGESGSGKSVSALSIANLLPTTGNCEIRGKIFFQGIDLLKLSKKELRSFRGSRIAYIFQEPSSSLHPQLTVGEQIEEVLRLHNPRLKNRKNAVIEALDEVQIKDAHLRYRDYPHQMSGGMLQRVMIAMALASRPKLLIADEPTTALDVTVQAHIIELLKSLREKYQMAVLLITHNFGIVDGFADRILVMRRGQIVESGRVADVLMNPEHPYTKGLINCIPRIGADCERLYVFDSEEIAS